MSYLDVGKQKANPYLENIKSIYMQIIEKTLTNNQLTEKMQ